jgi:hypothetical protein
LVVIDNGGHTIKSKKQQFLIADLLAKLILDFKVSLFLFVFLALRKAGCISRKVPYLSTLASDTAGKLDILGHDGDSLGMDGTQVGILKQTYKICFAGLLQSHHSRALESKVRFEVLCNFTDKALEWQFTDEQLCRLLVSSDLSQGNCSWPVSVWFLHTSSGWGRFTGCLGCQLLPGSFATCGLAGSLLGTGHVESSELTDAGGNTLPYLYSLPTLHRVQPGHTGIPAGRQPPALSGP